MLPRRAFLPLLVAGLLAACAAPRWPVDGRLTSPWGFRWDGAVPGLHRGVDIAVPDGTEVRVMAAGRVRFAGTMRGYGNVVWVDHGDHLLTVYAHLSEIRVRAAETVGRDALLGLSGMSGNATAPHLHFEVWRRGREVDPVAFLGGFPRTGISPRP